MSMEKSSLNQSVAELLAIFTRLLQHQFHLRRHTAERR
jgi:hypothetical protein